MDDKKRTKRLAAVTTVFFIAGLTTLIIYLSLSQSLILLILSVPLLLIASICLFFTLKSCFRDESQGLKIDNGVARIAKTTTKRPAKTLLNKSILEKKYEEKEEQDFSLAKVVMWLEVGKVKKEEANEDDLKKASQDKKDADDFKKAFQLKIKESKDETLKAMKVCENEPIKWAFDIVLKKFYLITIKCGPNDQFKALRKIDILNELLNTFNANCIGIQRNNDKQTFSIEFLKKDYRALIDEFRKQTKQETEYNLDSHSKKNFVP